MVLHPPIVAASAGRVSGEGQRTAAPPKPVIGAQRRVMRPRSRRVWRPSFHPSEVSSDKCCEACPSFWTNPRLARMPDSVGRLRSVCRLSSELGGCVFGGARTRGASVRQCRCALSRIGRSNALERSPGSPRPRRLLQNARRVPAAAGVRREAFGRPLCGGDGSRASGGARARVSAAARSCCHSPFRRLKRRFARSR